MQRIVGAGSARPAARLRSAPPAALRPSAARAQFPRPSAAPLAWSRDKFRLRQNSLLRRWRRRGIEQERGGVGLRLRDRTGNRSDRTRLPRIQLHSRRRAAASRCVDSATAGGVSGAAGVGVQHVGAVGWGRGRGRHARTADCDCDLRREDLGVKMTAVPSSGGGIGRIPICSKLASRVVSCARVCPAAARAGRTRL